MVKLVDTTDLKSVDGNIIPVQVRVVATLYVLYYESYSI